jgi:hypothetical protein
LKYKQEGYLDKNKTMDNVQKWYNICTNVPSSPTFGCYLNSQYFMVPEGSLQCSQEPVIGPYPEPDESSSQPPFLKKLNSLAVVRKRTKPTERPPLVGEVIAKLCW